MQGILQNMDKIIVDQKGGQGVVPYLPLDQLMKQRGTAKTDASSSGSDSKGPDATVRRPAADASRGQ